jgi:hypothetical protein
MKTVLRKLSLICAGFFVFAGAAPANPSGCSCSPCTCSPCHCGGSHHRDRARVGVGVGVDLGGVGRRRAEADPFAVPIESSSTSSRNEGKKTKKPAKESGAGNAFANIKLTGPDAKDTKLADASKGVSKP